MFNKITSFKIDRNSVEILDNELVKTASEILLPDGHQYDPDFVYMKVRAVSAGEYWGCFPEGQMVLMGDGSLKDIKDIVEGDEVYTHKGNIKKVLKKMTRIHNGDLYNVESKRLNTSILCTEEHPILAIKKDELKCNHDKYARCVPDLAGKKNICNLRSNLCPGYKKYNESWIEASDLEKNDYIAYKPFKPEESVSFTNEEMYFMGIYLAEGSISESSKNSSEIRLSLGLHEEHTLCKDIIDIANNLGFKSVTGPYKNEKKGLISVCLRSKEWVDKLDTFCGRLSYSKRLDRRLLNCENLNYLIQGYIDGDGHIDKTGRVVVTTVSKQLGRDLFDAIIETGYTPTYVVYKHPNEKHKDRHQISFSLKNNQYCDMGIKKYASTLKNPKIQSFNYNDKLYSRPSKIEKTDNFSGYVYNFEVEDDNSYIVNGICVHNCNKNADFFPEEELKKNYKTFFDAHVFKNHENKEIEKAIGDVLDATWNDEMKYVELFIRVDKRIAPTIARGFEKGFMTDVSMGCKIDHSICSICGNLAKTQSQYCDHIKYEKHKVRDDGKKVYEININPRFHDISAVLNGADRTAKMTGLFISGTKVAFNEEENMEKCASTLADALFDEPRIDYHYNSLSKKEENFWKNVDSLPIFDKTASTKVPKKASELEKIAEIKKRIKGNVLAVAQSRAALAEKERIENASQELRTGGAVRPLSEYTMNRFADGINRLSDSEEVMAEQVLTTALKMLSLAGVNLSPVEFIHIMRRVIGVNQPKVVRICPSHIDKEKLMHNFDTNVSIDRRFMRETNLPTIFNIVKSIQGHHLPTIKEKKAYFPATVIIKKVASCDGITRPEVPGLNLEDKVLKLASEIIEERSLHLPHLTKRAMTIESEVENEIEKEANMKKEASIIDHYYDFLVDTPVEKVASEDVYEAIERLAYGSYQNLVADYMDSQEFNGDLYRFASELGIDNASMEKCAKNISKAVNAGLGTYLYSKYQGVKAREGAPQSTLNRTIAENPELTAITAGMATKKVLDNSEKLKKVGKKALKYVTKTASENMDIYLGEEIDSVEDTLQDIDIFKDTVITTKMAMEYTPRQIELIKTASVMYAQGRQDLCDNLLSIEGLGYDSVNNFLQICEDTLFEELEKKASIGKVIAGVAGKATKVIGNMTTKAAPVVNKAVTGVKNVGSQVGASVAANATPEMKNMAKKVSTGVGQVKKDIGAMSTPGKIGLGASVVGTGLGVKNTLDNKKRSNEINSIQS